MGFRERDGQRRLSWDLRLFSAQMAPWTGRRLHDACSCGLARDEATCAGSAIIRCVYRGRWHARRFERVASHAVRRDVEATGIVSQQAVSAEAGEAHAAPGGGEHGMNKLGSLLCWAVVFADIGTSVYYTPG